MQRDIYFFHGLESTPHGRKYHALSEHFDVESPDFQGMDIEERLQKALALTEGLSDLIVVGSSYGGLLAALLYIAAPERFFGYLLCAPALALVDTIDSMPQHAIVVHGTDDDVVDIAPVREICAAHDVELIEVTDGHRLADSVDVLVDQVERLVQARNAAEHR